MGFILWLVIFAISFVLDIWFLSNIWDAYWAQDKSGFIMWFLIFAYVSMVAKEIGSAVKES
jgi:hypothetical protein